MAWLVSSWARTTAAFWEPVRAPSSRRPSHGGSASQPRSMVATSSGWESMKRLTSAASRRADTAAMVGTNRAAGRWVHVQPRSCMRGQRRGAPAPGSPSRRHLLDERHNKNSTAPMTRTTAAIRMSEIMACDAAADETGGRRLGRLLGGGDEKGMAAERQLVAPAPADRCPQRRPRPLQGGEARSPSGAPSSSPARPPIGLSTVPGACWTVLVSSLVSQVCEFWFCV